MSRTRRFLSGFAVAFGIGLAFLAGWVQLPYYSLGPGPAREVQPLISVSGHQEFPSQGKLIMTTVRFHTLSALGMLVAWIDPHQAVVSRETLYPPGETAEQETQRSLSQMDQSKIDAADVVLRRLTDYPKDHGDGALLEFVYPGCPAEGELFAGDVVTSIDGTPVHSARRGLDGARRGPGQGAHHVRGPCRRRDARRHDHAGEVPARRRRTPHRDQPDRRVPVRREDRERRRRRAVGGADVGARAVRPHDAGRRHGGPHDRGDGDHRHARPGRADRRDRGQGRRRAARRRHRLPGPRRRHGRAEGCRHGRDAADLRLDVPAGPRRAGAAGRAGDRGRRVRPAPRPPAAFRTACVRLGRRSRCAAPGRERAPT